MQAASRPRTWIWSVVLLSTLCCGRTQSTPLQVFDGARAFQDLLELVEIGPRPAGSEGAARARSLIAQRLRQAGWRVERHEFKAALPDGGHGLQMRQIGRPLIQAQTPHARADGAGADQHDLTSRIGRRAQLTRKRRDSLAIQRADLVGQHPRADLHNKHLGASSDFLTQQIGHRRGGRRNEFLGRTRPRREVKRKASTAWIRRLSGHAVLAAGHLRRQ